MDLAMRQFQGFECSHLVEGLIKRIVQFDALEFQVCHCSHLVEDPIRQHYTLTLRVSEGPASPPHYHPTHQHSSHAVHSHMAALRRLAFSDSHFHVITLTFHGRHKYFDSWIRHAARLHWGCVMTVDIGIVRAFTGLIIDLAMRQFQGFECSHLVEGLIKRIVQFDALEFQVCHCSHLVEDPIRQHYILTLRVSEGHMAALRHISKLSHVRLAFSDSHFHVI